MSTVDQTVERFVRDQLEEGWEEERYEFFRSIGFDEVHALNLAKDYSASIHYAMVMHSACCPLALMYEILR